MFSSLTVKTISDRELTEAYLLLSNARPLPLIGGVLSNRNPDLTASFRNHGFGNASFESDLLHRGVVVVTQIKIIERYADNSNACQITGGTGIFSIMIIDSKSR